MNKTTERIESETLARKFHEAYERLAPKYGYKTRKTSAVLWDKVPIKNKKLMIAVASEVLSCVFEYNLNLYKVATTRKEGG